MWYNSKMTKLQRLNLISLFAAMTFVITLVVSIPLPLIGYFNLSDATIFLGAIFIDPLGGAIAGAIGASLADITLGYGAYAPFTFFIKFIEALVTGLLFNKIHHRIHYIALFIGGFIMASLYLIPDSIFYDGNGNIFVNYFFNLVQGTINALIAWVTALALNRALKHLGRKTPNL